MVLHLHMYIHVKHFEICPIHLCMYLSPCLVLNCANPHFYLHLCRVRSWRRSYSWVDCLIAYFKVVSPQVRGLKPISFKDYFFFIYLIGEPWTCHCAPNMMLEGMLDIDVDYVELSWFWKFILYWTSYSFCLFRFEILNPLVPDSPFSCENRWMLWMFTEMACWKVPRDWPTPCHV